MWETFKRDLLTPRKLHIAASFHRDPNISVRPATSEDRKCRSFHCHDEITEILLVLDGSCEYMMGDRIYSGGPGTMLITEAEVVHEAVYPASAPAGRHFWILVMPNYFVYNLVHLDGKNYEMDTDIRWFPHYDPPFMTMFNRTLKTAARSRGDEVGMRELELLIKLRATQIVNIREEARKFNSHGAEMSNRLITERAMGYIREQCGRDCNIDLLSQMAGCSRTNFTRLFRKYAGCSVREYVDRVRIERYKSMNYRTPVKFLAQELGFSSASSFIHWRRQNVDKSKPLNWRTLTKEVQELPS